MKNYRSEKIQSISKRSLISTPSGKKFVFLFFISLFMFFSCNRNKQEMERIEKENEELRSQIEENQYNVEQYFGELNEIEENLALIKEREDIITDQAREDLELGISQQERINQDIELIGELMEKNRNLIASLNNRLRNADTRIDGFETIIERLNQTIEEKEVEIQLLRRQLSDMNLQVDMLSARVDTLEREAQEKSQRIRQQTMQMNTAWYAIGSRKELVDNDIIAREGGFLGIGRTERLKADFNHDFFTRIDITRDDRITIFGRRPELISVHPEDSYQIYSDQEENYLEIEDHDKFWEATRYLVIQVR